MYDFNNKMDVFMGVKWCDLAQASTFNWLHGSPTNISELQQNEMIAFFEQWYKGNLK